MKHLDEELASAFRRQDPSPDLLARILEELPPEQPAVVPIRRRWQPVLAVAATVTILASVGLVGELWISLDDDPPPQKAEMASTATDEKRAPEQPPAPQPGVTPTPRSDAIAKTPKRRVRRTRPHRAPAPPTVDPAEALAAEQLVRALQITNGTLAEVREAVVDEQGRR